MNPTIRKLLLILLSELTLRERVKFFEKIPTKRVPLTTRTPESVQRKIITDALKNKNNVEFILKQITNNKLHHLIGDDARYEISSLRSNEELVSQMKKYKLHTDKLLLNMFETTELEDINRLFPSSREIEELLKATQEIKEERKEDINTNTLVGVHQEIEYKNEIDELKRRIVKKDRILDSNKKKYEQTIERLNKQSESAIKDRELKMTEHEREIVENSENSIRKMRIEKEDIYKNLRNEQNKNLKLIEMIKRYQKEIDKLKLESNKKKVLLIADKSPAIKDIKGVSFSRVSEEDDLSGVAASIKEVPVSEVWIVREQVSGVFFHKLQQEFKHMKIQRVSLAYLLTKGE